MNLAGLALGSLWLAAVNQWQYVGLGIIAIFFAPYIIPLLLLPSGLFSYYMTLYRNAGHKGKEQFMYIVAIAYILAFMTFWCVSLFYYTTYAASAETLASNVFWGVIVSVMPLLWWASRDRENIFVLMLVEIAQISTIVLALCRFFDFVVSYWAQVFLFGSILTVIVGSQVWWEDKKSKSNTDSNNPA